MIQERVMTTTLSCWTDRHDKSLQHVTQLFDNDETQSLPLRHPCTNLLSATSPQIVFTSVNKFVNVVENIMLAIFKRVL